MLITEKLDALVTKFRETGCKDLELLLQIIEQLRSKPKATTDLYPAV